MFAVKKIKSNYTRTHNFVCTLLEHENAQTFHSYSYKIIRNGDNNIKDAT